MKLAFSKGSDEKREWLKIAKRVRRCVEDIVKNDFRNERDCAGYCGRAAPMLQQELKHAGYDAKIAYVFDGFAGHAFIILNGHVIDVTATQFGEHRKSIVHRVVEEEKWFWHKPERFFNTPQEWIDWQTKEGWTDWQTGRASDLAKAEASR